MKIIFTEVLQIPFAELFLLLYLKYNTSVILYLLFQQCTSGDTRAGYTVVDRK
jgi:hypothetical protein